MREKYWWFTEESKSILEKGYLKEGQTIEDKIDKVSKHAGSYYPDKPELVGQFKEMFERGWCSMSSPIIANFAEERGLPISCFSSPISDSLDKIYDALSEVAMMTKRGGGTAGYFGKLRPAGSKVGDGGISSGAVSFYELFDKTTEVVSQSGVRRGAFAAYIDIDHPEVLEFIKTKDKDSTRQSTNTAVIVTNDWMNKMIEGDSEKRNIWAQVLKNRREKGIPYILFKDNINDNKPEIYKDLDLEITHSNACSEVMLPTSDTESFVCCLMSLNLTTYDEWKDTNVVERCVYFLDAVMQEFIDKTENDKHLQRARNFAIRHRALGIGTFGLHTLFQQKKLSFGDFKALILDRQIHNQIKKQSYDASIKLGIEKGNAPIFEEGEHDDVPRRNTCLIAIAPTTSSAAIFGQVSQSIEPLASNYYVFGSAKGSFTRKNRELEKLLVDKGCNTDEVWQQIMIDKGSVKNIDCLTEEEKNIFKTFDEISPYDIIRHASSRQTFIDQGQSINLKIPNEMEVKDINAIHIEAWKSGLKALYYQRGTSVAKEAIKEMLSCSSCEA